MVWNWKLCIRSVWRDRNGFLLLTRCMNCRNRCIHFLSDFKNNNTSTTHAMDWKCYLYWVVIHGRSPVNVFVPLYSFYPDARWFRLLPFLLFNTPFHIAPSPSRRNNARVRGSGLWSRWRWSNWLVSPCVEVYIDMRTYFCDHIIKSHYTVWTNYVTQQVTIWIQILSFTSEKVQHGANKTVWARLKSDDRSRHWPQL